MFEFQPQPTILTDIHRIYGEEKEKLHRHLDQRACKFSLTISLMKGNLRKNAHCCLIAHFIDDDWEQKMKILAFKNLENIYDTGALSGIIGRSVSEWNIGKKVCSITVDYSSLNDDIVKQIKESCFTDQGSFLSSHCFTSCTLVQDGLHEIDDILLKMRKSIEHVSEISHGKLKFEEALKKVKLQGGKSRDDLPLRLDSDLGILETALELREIFCQQEQIDGNFKVNPSRQEWDKALALHSCLKGFEGTDQSLTANVYFPKLCDIYLKFQSEKSNYLFASLMKRKFDYHWSLCNLVFAVAAVLDPRLKFKFVEYSYGEIYGCDSKMQYLDRLRKVLVDVYNEYANELSNLTTSASAFGSASTHNAANDCILDSFSRYISASNFKEAASWKSELDIYLDEPLLPRDGALFDILGWWRDNSERFPTLGRMARDFLAIPMSVVPSCSDLNALITNPVYSSLNHESMEALACSQNWLEMPKGRSSESNSNMAKRKMEEKETRAVNSFKNWNNDKTSVLQNENVQQEGRPLRSSEPSHGRDISGLIEIPNGDPSFDYQSEFQSDSSESDGETTLREQGAWHEKGCLLNRFAALVEIYDMLQKICFKYELKLALTWACGTNVNEIMSDPYKKCKKRKRRILFLESTSCYVNHWDSQVFMERCAKHRLREGQAIAGKALQSSEDFHFEPSITKLKKREYPLASVAQEFGSHAVVAVCLQNHCTIDDVYVVELFLETATKSEIATKKLASDIFNDLKNMKKKFVTLRVQGPEVGFQEDEIKAISIPPLEPLSSVPQGIIIMTNPPQASLTANVLNSDTIGYINTIELKDYHTMETRGLNEQVGVIPNFQPYSEPIYASSPTGASPFNAPNSTSYNGVLETIVCEQPMFEFQPQPTILNDIHRIYGEEKKKLQRHFDQLASHFIDDDWELKMKILAFKNLENIYDTGALSGIIGRSVSEWNMGKKVCSITVDNSSLNDDIVQQIKESCFRDQCSFLSSHCFTSCTLVQDGLHEIDDILLKMRKSIEYVSEIPHGKLKFEEALKKVKLQGGKSRDDLPLRLDSDFGILGTALELREIFCQLEEIDGNFKVNPSREEWDMALALHSCLKGFEGTDQSLTANVYFPNLCNIYKKFLQLEKSNYPFASLMKRKFDNYWSLCNLVFTVAVVLDPQLKFKFVEFSYFQIYGCDSKMKLNRLHKVLVDVYDEYANELRNLTTSASAFGEFSCSTNTHNAASDCILDSFSRYISASNFKEAASWQSELDCYLDEDLLPRDGALFDILGWWRVNSSRFPTLGRMAHDILAIPMSVVPPCLDLNALITNPAYSSLNHESLEALVCSQNWLEMPKGRSTESNSNMAKRKMEEKETRSVKSFKNWNNDKTSILQNENAQQEGRPLRSSEPSHGRDISGLIEIPNGDPSLDNQSEFQSDSSESDGETTLREQGAWHENVRTSNLIGRDKEFSLVHSSLAPLLIIPSNVETRVEYHIDDSVVNTFFKLLKKRSDRFPKAYIKHYSFDSGVATCLIEGSRPEYEVLAWFIDEKLIGVHKLFLPLCLSSHWILFYVDTKDLKFSWLDSNISSRMSNIVEKGKILGWFTRYLLPTFGYNNANEWPFEVRNDIPVQNK
ncbi:hypothetical protein REPUB_Repub15cG0121700 [Reevesia pubescens]